LPNSGRRAEDIGMTWMEIFPIVLMKKQEDIRSEI